MCDKQHRDKWIQQLMELTDGHFGGVLMLLRVFKQAVPDKSCSTNVSLKLSKEMHKYILPNGETGPKCTWMSLTDHPALILRIKERASALAC